jgi:hypothetical protein
MGVYAGRILKGEKAAKGAYGSDDVLLRYPITGTAACCARARGRRAEQRDELAAP